MTRAIQFVLLTIVFSFLFGPAGVFAAILVMPEQEHAPRFL